MKNSLGIVGDGIAALCFLKFYLKNKPQIDKIYWFSPQNQQCSINSTAVVAIRGIEAGVSKLGDWLIDGFKQVEQLYVNKEIQGIEKAIHYQLWSERSEKNEKRFKNFSLSYKAGELCFSQDLYASSEDAYIFYPVEFINHLRAEVLDLLRPYNFEVLNRHVQHLKILDDGFMLDEINVQKVVECTGHGELVNPIMPQDWQEKVRLKSAAGRYLEWSDCKLFNDSFSITLNGINLIYRAKNQTLQLGSITNDPMDLHLDETEFSQMLIELQKFIPILNSLQIENAKEFLGHRVKAKKRWPAFGEAQAGLFAINGLYKNGYSLAFSLGNEMVARLK